MRALLQNRVQHRPLQNDAHPREVAGAVRLGQQRLGAGTTVGDLRFLNQIPRRARQFSEIGLIFHAVPPELALGSAAEREIDACLRNNGTCVGLGVGPGVVGNAVGAPGETVGRGCGSDSDAEQ